MSFQATVAGRLTDDVQDKEFNNSTVANFSIAVNQPDKKNQEQPPIYLDCSAWGKMGDKAIDKLRKGSGIVASGKISQDTFTNKKGEQAQKLKMTVAEFYTADWLMKDITGGSMTREMNSGYDNAFGSRDVDSEIPF